MTDPNTPIIEYATPRAARKNPAAMCLVVGGMFLFVMAWVEAWFTDALVVDLLALVLAWLGSYVGSGNRRAGAWALVVTAVYGIAGIEPFVDRVLATLAGAPPRKGGGLVLVSFAAVQVTWSFTAAYLLARFLWPRRGATEARFRRRILLSLAGLCLVVTGGWCARHWIRAQTVESAPRMSTLIDLRDSETGEPLQARVEGPSVGREDRWSVSYVLTPSAQMQVHWRAVEPLPIRVSSPGYAPREILLDDRAGAVTTVEMRSWEAGRGR